MNYTKEELEIKMIAWLKKYEKARIDYANCYHPGYGMAYDAYAGQDFNQQVTHALKQAKKLHAMYLNLGCEYYDYRLI